MKRAISLLLISGLTSSCSQMIHVRTPKADQELIFNGNALGKISEQGINLRVPMGFNNVHFEIYEDGQLFRKGSIARSQIDGPTFAASLTGALIAVPIFTLLGIVAVNPYWLLTPGIFYAGGGAGSARAFTIETTSAFTIPVATIFGLIGLLPLLGLLNASKLPTQITFD